MFGWLRKNKAENTADELTRLVAAFAALLQAHPHCIMDVSLLPTTKEKMINIFRTLLLADAAKGNEKMLKMTEDYWCLLGRFQPGVGSNPIDFEIAADNPTVKVWREQRDRVEKWLVIANAESEHYEREIERLRHGVFGPSP